MLWPPRPGCSIRSDVASPRPAVTQQTGHFRTVGARQAGEGDPQPSKRILHRIPVPCARHPRPRPRRLRRPRGRCSPETRSQPALRQPPGRASPTFSGQEGGRPRAFPVVQPKRAETSLHSHSLGCQRTEAKVQPPPGPTERGSPGSPLCPGRGPAPGARTAAGSGEPSWHLGRAPPPPRPASLAQGFLRAGALPWCPGAGGSTCLARVS